MLDVGAAADEMPDVRLGKLIVSEVAGLDAHAAKVGDDGVDLLLALGGGRAGRGRRARLEVERADDVAAQARRKAVRELGNGTRVEVVVQLDERSRALGHLERHEHLAALTDLGALSDEAQTPKVHVATRHDGDKLLAAALEAVAHDVRLEACERERA